MLKKFIAAATFAVLTFAIALFPQAGPAQAVPTGDTGSIYYVGAWNMGDANVDPFWTGIRRLDLASGDDIALDLNSPTCAGLASSSTSGLAVDVPHKRLYWTATDGVNGLFALDMATGKCYTLEADTSPRGVAISEFGNTLTWGVRVYNPTTTLFDQELRTMQVTDLQAIVDGSVTPTSVTVEISGFSGIQISDLEPHNGRLYALMDATEDASLSSHNFIYSYGIDDLTITPIQESDTGVIGTPYQFQIGADAYYVSTFDQIYKIDFGSPGASWGMMLDQVSGFALVGNHIYSGFTRDQPIKMFDLATNTGPTDLDSLSWVDMYSYLAYAAPILAPSITASTAHSTNGTVNLPFSGVTPTGNEKIGYSLVPRSGGSPSGGFCVLVGSSCRITGLDDSKIYDVTLRLAYTYEDPTDLANPTHVIIASGPSNSVQVNDGVVNPPPPPTPSALKSVKTITGFNFEKSPLTASAKKAIKAWVNSKTGYTKVTCVGYTGYNWNKRSSAFLTKLALARATNVCNYIHALKPSITVISKTAKKDSSQKSASRRVIATITN
jgi:hypothetical protein